MKTEMENMSLSLYEPRDSICMDGYVWNRVKKNNKQINYTIQFAVWALSWYYNVVDYKVVHTIFSIHAIPV